MISNVQPYKCMINVRYYAFGSVQIGPWVLLEVNPTIEPNLWMRKAQTCLSMLADTG